MYKIFIISIMIIFLFLGAIFCPCIFPNFLNIDFNNYDLTIKLFSNISVILASIFGMTIAIFLVSFQIFKKNYVSYSIKDFFKDANIGLLFITYLSTILISYTSLIFIRQNYYSSKIVNLYYLSFSLFIICILLLYFLIKSILTSKYSNNRVKEVISGLKYDDIKNYSEKYSSELTLPKGYKDINKNPHLFLEEMLANAVKRKDDFAIREYFEKLRCKIYELTDNCKDREERNKIFNFFREIIVKTSQVAIKEYEKAILLTVLNSIFPIYLHCINRNITGEDLKELDYTLTEILLLVVEANNLLPIRFPVFLLGIKNNIISLLKKQKVYVENYPEKRLINILYKIIDKAIIVRAESIVRDVLKSFTDIIYEVIEASDIDELKKIEIVNKNCFYYKYYLLRSVDRGFYDVEVLGYSFNSDKLINVIKKNADFGKQILMLYCTVLLELINRDILDDFLIENLGKIGENIIVSNDIANSNESILYIFMIMDRMRNKVEDKSDEVIIYKYDILCEQIKSLKKMIDSNKQKFSKIYDKISSISRNFAKTKFIGFVGDEPINWPKID